MVYFILKGIDMSVFYDGKLDNVVNTVADLYNLSKAVEKAIYITLGYSTIGIGSNLYRYSLSHSGTPDGGFILDGIGGNGTGTGIGRFIALDQSIADVTKFGVIPNISTSGVVATNNIAFANACNSTAKKIVFPSDNNTTTYYFFNPGLSLPVGKILIGDSYRDVRLRPRTQTIVSDDFLTINSECVVRDISIQGFPASGSASLGDGLVIANGANRWLLEKVRSIQWGVGFHLINTWIGELNGCIAQSCSTAGLQTSGAEINQILIHGGEFASSPSCIKMTTGCNSFIIHSTIEGATDTGNAYGIFLTGAYIYNNFVCENSYFESNKTHHIYADSNCVLIGGKISGNGFFPSTSGHSINVTRADSVDFGINNYTYTPPSGVHLNLASTCINCTINKQIKSTQTLDQYATINDSGNNTYIGYTTRISFNDTTPSVRGLSSIIINNTSGITITDFDDPVNNQKISVVLPNSNTTIQNNANIKLDNSLNFTTPSGGTLSLINYSGVWYETARAIF